MATAQKTIRPYSVMEEIVHAGTHAVGIILAAIALVFLLVKASDQGVVSIAAVSIYAGCMILMYACSTVYHSMFKSKLQPFFKMLDHSAIYFKIAGSYTPFALITLPASTGVWVMVGVWGAALSGTAFKLIAFLRKSGKKMNYISLGIYLAMGWAGVLMVGPLADALPTAALYWLFAGGAFFTIGAVFYAIKSVAYFHAVWHVFVLLGSASHFFAIYWFVI